ncbi:MAG: hypothetical protein ACRENE_32105 [Polyangiaceae bacterium]
MKLEPLVEMPNNGSGIWRRFAVHMFEGHLSIDDMARVENVGVQWLKQNPGKLVEMVVIYPSDSVGMTSEERSRMGRLIKRWEDVRVASATVILASGIMGSVQRSVLTGLQAIARPPHPTKVFSTRAEGVGWLMPYVQEACGRDANRDDLVAAVEELSARFTARARDRG